MTSLSPYVLIGRRPGRKIRLMGP